MTEKEIQRIAEEVILSASSDGYHKTAEKLVKLIRVIVDNARKGA